MFESLFGNKDKKPSKEPVKPATKPSVNNTKNLAQTTQKTPKNQSIDSIATQKNVILDPQLAEIRQKELQEMDEQFVLHSYARDYTHFVKGQNAKLFSSNGRDYIDFTSGIGVCSVGHGNEKLATAIANAAKNLIHTSNLFLIEPQAMLAKRLVEMAAMGDYRVFFGNSGAEANEGAIKIARKYGAQNGGKYQVITLDSSFHGRTISTLKATAQEKFHAHFGPYPDGFVYAKDIEDIPNKVRDTTCAVLLELVQGEGGVMPFSRDSVRNLAKFCAESKILLMVDEVQTGIFRSGELLASKVYGISPDVVSLAKGLGGGVPIGAVMTKLVDIFEPGDHGSTFGGNFLSCAAGLAVLDILEEQKQSGAIDNCISHFMRGVRGLGKEFPELFGEEVGLGLMRGLRVKSDALLGELVAKARECGVLVLKSGKATMRFLPPITISTAEMDEGFARLKKACLAVKQAISAAAVSNEAIKQTK